MRLLVDPILSQRNSKVYLSHVHAVLYVHCMQAVYPILKLIFYHSLHIKDGSKKIKQETNLKDKEW